MRSADRPTLGIIGGTGALGTALAKCWAAAGYAVVLGSRSRAKAIAAAKGMQHDGSLSIGGDHNVGAARAGDIVVITVPYANHDATLEEIREAVAGKIVIDAVVPLVPPKVSVVYIPDEVSAAQRAQDRLGPGVRVVSAFHNVGAAKLEGGGPLECDVLVFGDNEEARDAVIDLVAETGARGVHGGPIANSVAGEALTAVLIGINRRYKVKDAGIRITGIPADLAAS